MMNMIKSPDEIALMREAGRVVANALAAVREAAAVGVSLKELDDVAAASIADAGATPAFLNYRPRWASVPFPGVICASVNDAVVHGIPNGYRLQDGDLLSVDCGAFLEGWCGDAAVSFVVGTADPVDQELIAATDAALARGIEAARIGNKMGDLAYAIGGAAHGRATGCWPTTAGTASAAPCTQNRLCPTAGVRAGTQADGRARDRHRADAHSWRRRRLLP